jgi:uncharacterized protein YqgV (UPF0045/DUF77 family)
MRISAEVSLYPLVDDYKPLVRAFIAELEANPQLEIRVGGLSTQIFGTIDQIMPTLQKATTAAFEKNKMAVVLKMIATDVSQYEYKPKSEQEL